MTLSIIKLRDLLMSKGFTPTKFFTMQDFYFYIELTCLETAEKILLYIPSKYEIKIQDLQDTYKLKNINIEKSDDITDEYAEKPDNLKLQSTYNTIDLDIEEDIETKLKQKYDQNIQIGNISEIDMTELKSIYRQVSRLKYCVKNFSYKLGIFYKNYLCSIRRDDSIDCFFIKKYPRLNHKQLIIIIDLESVYSTDDNQLKNDICTLKKSIHSILEKNQLSHSDIIDKLLQSKKSIINIPQMISNKNNSYSDMIIKLENMLNTMNKAEKDTLNKLNLLEEKVNNGNLQSDIERIHTKSKFEKQLENIQKIKYRISDNIFNVSEKRDDTLLNMDKIMFDNAVMFDCIVKNFAKLKDLC